MTVSPHFTLQSLILFTGLSRTQFQFHCHRFSFSPFLFFLVQCNQLLKKLLLLHLIKPRQREEMCEICVTKSGGALKLERIHRQFASSHLKAIKIIVIAEGELSSIKQRALWVSREGEGKGQKEIFKRAEIEQRISSHSISLFILSFF